MKRGALVTLTLLAALALLSLFAGRYFRVRTVEVTGNERFTSEEILEMSGLGEGGSVFSVSEDAVKAALERDAYIECLSVKTTLPDTVEIAVRERVGVGVGYVGGALLLFDAQGVILEELSALPEKGAVLVTGMDASRSRGGDQVNCASALRTGAMKAVLAAIAEQNLSHLVSELNVASTDNLYLVSRTGVQVILGNEEMLYDKLVWFQTVLASLTEEGVTGGVLDVSSGKNAVYADR